MSLASQISFLELLLVFQDDTIQALNDVIVEQQMALTRIQKQLELLAQRQNDMHNQFDETPNDPPPHY